MNKLLTIILSALCSVSLAVETTVKVKESCAPGKPYTYKTPGGKEQKMEITSIP